MLRVPKLLLIKSFAFARLFHRKKHDLLDMKNKSPLRIGIYLKAGIGDFVQILPLLISLYEKSNEITIFTTNEIVQVKSFIPKIDKISYVIVKGISLRNKIQVLFNEFRFIRSKYFDLLYFPPIGFGLTMAITAAFSKSRNKIGFNVSNISTFLDKVMDFDYSTSIINMNNSVLSLFGISLTNIVPNLIFAQDKTAFKLNKYPDRLTLLDGEYICIYPHTYNKHSYLRKVLPYEFWVRFLELILPNSNIPLVFLGNIFDKPYNIKIISHISSRICYDFSGSDLEFTLDIIKCSKCIMGIDGGIMHLAQLINKYKITFWYESNLLNYGYDDGFNINFMFKTNESILLGKEVYNVEKLSSEVTRYISKLPNHTYNN